MQFLGFRRCYSLKDNSVEGGLEPVLCLVLGDLLEETDSGPFSFSLGDSGSGSLEDNVEIHTENTSVGVVFQSEVDMLLDSESEAA